MSNKSEATWHPNSGPEMVGYPPPHIPHADALVALGDTVPREQYDMMARRGNGYKRADDERTDERDALAHKLAEVRFWRRSLGSSLTRNVREILLGLDDVLRPALAVSLALHDAEVWDEGFDQGVEYEGGQSMDRLNPYRAAAIREEAK